MIMHDELINYLNLKPAFLYRCPRAMIVSFFRLQTRQWSEKVIKTITRDDWLVHEGLVKRDFQVLVTPRVVEEVRRHFNCSLLEGAELEDQGEDGTALTHWEKRVFEVRQRY